MPSDGLGVPGTTPVYVLDDDPVYARDTLAKFFLEPRGLGHRLFTKPADLLAAMRQHRPCLLILDLYLDGTAGNVESALAVLREVKRDHPTVKVLTISGAAKEEDWLLAAQAGADSFWCKGPNLRHLEERIQICLQDLQTDVPGLLGRSPRMAEVRLSIQFVAPRGISVLIRGETGTGKEVVAKTIHRQSQRADKPFTAVNVAAFSEDLLENELFGHEEGGFTGAVRRKQGRLELANGGTLFLDEIGEISPSAQVKLLRFLQEREFERVGGTETIRVDTRVIAATNSNLEAEMATEHFRKDLYYRLSGIEIRLPPLRERLEDIDELTRHFLSRLGNRSEISDDALDVLSHYTWPGNVRELEQVVAVVNIYAGDGAVRAEHVRKALAGKNVAPTEVCIGADGALKGHSKLDVLRAFVHHSNKTVVAKELHVSRRGLQKWLNREGLSTEEEDLSD